MFVYFNSDANFLSKINPLCPTFGVPSNRSRVPTRRERSFRQCAHTLAESYLKSVSRPETPQEYRLAKLPLADFQRTLQV